jgi:hypothetical protein
MNQIIEIITPDKAKVERRVKNVVKYLDRHLDFPNETLVIHHRESGGKTHYRRKPSGYWLVERRTYA